MRIRELREKIEVVREVRSGVSEWGDNENAFLIEQCSRSGGYVVEVDVVNRGTVHFYGLVVVEDDRGL